jgi:hypothetical protein
VEGAGFLRGSIGTRGRSRAQDLEMRPSTMAGVIKGGARQIVARTGSSANSHDNCAGCR